MCATVVCVCRGSHYRYARRHTDCCKIVSCLFSCNSRPLPPAALLVPLLDAFRAGLYCPPPSDGLHRTHPTTHTSGGPSACAGGHTPAPRVSRAALSALVTPAGRTCGAASSCRSLVMLPAR